MLSLLLFKPHTARFIFQRTVGIIHSLSSVFEMVTLEVGSSVETDPNKDGWDQIPLPYYVADLENF